MDESKEAPKYVGVWTRVSTKDQARGESPANHEQRARAYAMAKGWHMAEDAVKLWLETLSADGQPIPEEESTPEVQVARISAPANG